MITNRKCYQNVVDIYCYNNQHLHLGIKGSSLTTFLGSSLEDFLACAGSGGSYEENI